MKHSPEIKKRVLELHKLINLHSHNYHSLDTPTIEDQEYYIEKFLEDFETPQQTAQKLQLD